MELMLENLRLTEVAQFRHATCYFAEDHKNTLIVQATSPYIPKTQFQELFIAVGQLVVLHNIEKLVFDKRSLKVFHQPSMEWYFLVWKEAMYHHGLRVHRKLLPDNEIFRESVSIGRDKIKAMYPHGYYTKMDIQYAESLEEALEK